MSSWDARFLERSPMLAPLRVHAARLEQCDDWPTRDELQSLVSGRGITNASGQPLVVVAPSDDAYEAQLYTRGELQVRERNWHDVFNVLAWLTFQKTKRELNRRHALEAQGEIVRGRGRVRDALTLFDESGAIVASADPSLLEAIHNFRWHEVFRARRSAWRDDIRVIVFGHALCEKALAPYVGMTAHATLVEVDREALHAPTPMLIERLDEITASRVCDGDAFTTPRALAPLPVLGVPGWSPANEREAFYENAEYFRPGRRR